ncbi:MAG TPA: cytochrome c3 family protein [Crenalkalicoccus sp.]|nr:cytochrome c3 family protein [Crenalkalicoccus sp.]
MPQLFSRWTNTAARAGLLTLVLAPFLTIGVLAALPFTPYVTGQHRFVDQPVPFSHEHHVGGLGLHCLYCHTGVTRSPYAGLPPTHTCMTCHSQLWTNAEVLAPVRESLARGQPIAWQRVNILPGYVYFDHSIHVAKGVGCSTCHGAVDRMPLTVQAAPLTMGWCLDCHRNPAPNLRPDSEIFNTEYRVPEDQDRLASELLRQYHIRTDHLTDCSICHR